MIGGARTVRALSRAARSVALAAVLVATSGAGALAAPRDNAAEVETAEQLFAKQDYERANDQADRVVKQRGLTHDQLVRASRVLAITSALLGREDFARDAFVQLLVYDPDAALDPSVGTRVSTPFVEARAQVRGLSSRPGLEVVANVRADGGQLRVTTRDPTRIAKKLSVGYRWTASGEYVVAPLTVGLVDGTVDVAPAPPGRNRLDFYAQAFDERDNAVFEAGNPQVPKSAFADPEAAGTGGRARPGPLDEEPHRSITASPLFWILTGVVVVGGGAALFFAVRPQDHGPTTAVLSPAIRCGNDLCR